MLFSRLNVLKLTLVSFSFCEFKSKMIFRSACHTYLLYFPNGGHFKPVFHESLGYFLKKTQHLFSYFIKRVTSRK